MKKLVMTAIATVFTTGVVNAAPDKFVEAYFIPSSEIDVTVDGLGSASVDGDGFGVRGKAPLAIKRLSTVNFSL